MRFVHRSLVALATLSGLSASTANPASTPLIAWGTCAASWVGQASAVLGNRLQCGSITAPFDHLAPDGRSMSIGVVRVRASDPMRREGAIFLNIGGPGAHPGRLLRSMGETWSDMSAGNPDEVDKRRLSQRYDLVAVIPRGLTGSGDLRCAPARHASPHAFLPTHLDDNNWQLILDGTQTAVDACTSIPEARYVNTEQHAHDMDTVRRALGDERLHFYGISYGGMVGAWYASLYPSHTGRLLLDSTMDLMHGYRSAAYLSMVAQQHHFDEDIVAPVLRHPARYGLGESSGAVASEIDDLPPRAREAWAGRLDSSAHLAAALHLAEWLNADSLLTKEAMMRRIDHTVFSQDMALGRRMRLEASQLAPLLYPQVDAAAPYVSESEGEFVRVAVGCNDFAWTRSEAEIRESARRYAGRYFNFNGDQTLEELACTRWGGPRARRPDLSRLSLAEPFLLIQSEKDTSTPLVGAQHILHAFSNARMLLVRRADLHGVFNYTNSSCIERTAAHYLLTGELPALASRAFSCDDIFDHPVDALPGSPSSNAEPTAIDEPTETSDHVEL
jgi:pimeloyl-ACP methyl ester carboxylesterase